MRGAALIALFAALAGCGHNVGDPCSVNIDCSIAGDRFCDTSEPGGYCTIDGCDLNTCPSEATCVRFFTPVQDEPCQFGKPYPDNGCRVDERCLCDNSQSGMCVNNEAHCAPDASEHRWCQLKCGSDSDCRSGYECRETGTLGAEPVPAPDGGTMPAKFCAPATP